MSGKTNNDCASIALVLPVTGPVESITFYIVTQYDAMASYFNDKVDKLAEDKDYSFLGGKNVCLEIVDSTCIASGDEINDIFHNIMKIKPYPLAALGFLCSGFAQQISPMLDASNILSISSWHPNPRLNRDIYKHYFDTEAGEDSVPISIARDILKRGYRIAAVLTDGVDEFDLAQEQIFIHEFKRLGGKIENEDEKKIDGPRVLVVFVTDWTRNFNNPPMVDLSLRLMTTNYEIYFHGDSFLNLQKNIKNGIDIGLVAFLDFRDIVADLKKYFEISNYVNLPPKKFLIKNFVLEDIQINVIYNYEFSDYITNNPYFEPRTISPYIPDQTIDSFSIAILALQYQYVNGGFIYESVRHITNKTGNPEIIYPHNLHEGIKLINEGKPIRYREIEFDEYNIAKYKHTVQRFVNGRAVKVLDVSGDPVYVDHVKEIVLVDVDEIAGDVNKDNIISGADVVYLASHVAGIEGYENVDKYTADNNNDGEVTGADVVYLASHVAGIEGFNIPNRKTDL